jgi:uncharacterized protein YjbI with pentapeptide repeats
MNESQRLQLKAIILAEINKYQKVTGQRFPRWKTKLNQYVDKGYFVTFTSVPELSLNPVNDYNTPTGIYSYQLATGNKVADFATNRQFAIVFKPKPGLNLLHLQKYNLGQYDADKQKLLKLLPEPMVAGFIDEAEENAKVQNRGGYLWYVTRAIANQLEKHKETARRNNTGEMSVKHKKEATYSDTSHLNRVIPIDAANEWTKILRNTLGYHGVIDEGDGIIHSHEPAQAVFWESRYLDTVEMIEKEKTEWSPDTHYEQNDTEETLTAFRMQLKTGTVEGLTWPSDVSFKGKTLKNATFRNTVFRPASMEGTTVQNVRFMNSRLGVANTYEGLYKATLSNVSVQLDKASSSNPMLGDRVDTCKLENVHGKGTAPMGRIYQTTINNLSVEDFYLQSHILCVLYKCNVDGYMMKGCSATAQRLEFESSTVENLVIDDCKLGTVRFDRAHLTNAVFKDTRLDLFILVSTSLTNVDLTGLTVKTVMKAVEYDGITAQIHNVKVTRELFNKIDASEEFKSKLTVVDEPSQPTV